MNELYFNLQVPSLSNDLWFFDVSSGKWTWVGGDSTYNHPGVYSGDNVRPGARYGALMWAINATYIYLFGGYGYGPFGAGKAHNC